MTTFAICSSRYFLHSRPILFPPKFHIYPFPFVTAVGSLSIQNLPFFFFSFLPFLWFTFYFFIPSFIYNTACTFHQHVIRRDRTSHRLLILHSSKTQWANYYKSSEVHCMLFRWRRPFCAEYLCNLSWAWYWRYTAQRLLWTLADFWLCSGSIQWWTRVLLKRSGVAACYRTFVPHGRRERW